MKTERQRRRPIGRLVTRLTLATLLAQGTSAATALERPATADLDLAGTTMADALLEIGRRYRVIISFHPSLVEGLQITPLRGRYTLGEALQQALRNGNLTAEISADGIVAVRRADRGDSSLATTAAAEGDKTSETPPPESAPVPQTVELQRVIIQGKAELDFEKPESGFAASSSDAATLSDTPLSQVPQALSVVTRDMITAARVRTQLEALGFATGVSAFGSNWMQAPPAKVRGFPAQFSLSGLTSMRSVLPLDSASIERIEVVKGPSGVVGGIAGEEGRGGVINVVRKRPVPGQKSEATLQVESRNDGSLRTTADLGGGDARTLWRLVSYRTRSRRDESRYAPSHTDGVLGSMSHRSESHIATLTLQREHRREVPPGMARVRMGDGGHAYEISSEEEVPVSRDDGLYTRIDDAELDAVWRLSDRWRVRTQARAEHAEFDATDHHYNDAFWMAGMERRAVQARGRAGRASLLADLQTGRVKHKLLLGADVQTQRTATRYVSAGWYVNPQTFVPGQTPLSDAPGFGSLDAIDLSPTKVSEQGTLLQDHLRIDDATVRLALRHARYTESHGGWDSKFSGRNWDVGATWRLLPDVTVYAGAQATINATGLAGQLFNGLYVAPSQTRQQQAGAKFDLQDGELALTLEAYRLQQRNVTHLNEEGRQPDVLPGKNSTGFEVELSGRAGASLDVSFGVNVMRTHSLNFAGLDAAPRWQPGCGTPERSMHLLLNYRLSSDEGFNGTSLGAGVRAQSGSWATAPGGLFAPLRIPGGAQVNLSWMHRERHWSFGLFVQNLFDRRLYQPTNNSEYVPLVPGRNVGLTLGYVL